MPRSLRKFAKIAQRTKESMPTVVMILILNDQMRPSWVLPMRRVATEATLDEEVFGTVEPLELRICSQNPVWKYPTHELRGETHSSLLPRQSQFVFPSQTKYPRQSGNRFLEDFSYKEIDVPPVCIWEWWHKLIPSCRPGVFRYSWSPWGRPGWRPRPSGRMLDRTAVLHSPGF